MQNSNSLSASKNYESNLPSPKFINKADISQKTNEDLNIKKNKIKQPKVLEKNIKGESPPENVILSAVQKNKSNEIKKIIIKIRKYFYIAFSMFLMATLVNIYLTVEKSKYSIGYDKVFMEPHKNIYFVNDVYFALNMEKCSGQLQEANFGEYPGLKNLCICPEE